MGNPPDPAQFWTWTTLISLAFTTGVITALFNSAFSIVTENLKRRAQNAKEGAAAAHLLVPILTAYAHECAKRLVENGQDKSEGLAGGHTKMPAMPEYSSTILWSSLPGRIAAGINDLRIEIREADAFISASADYDPNPEEVAASANVKFALVGWKAYTLAKKLRRRYSLGMYQSTTISYHWISPLRAHYRSLNPNLLERAWNSYPAAKLRFRYKQWKRERRNRLKSRKPPL